MGGKAMSDETKARDVSVIGLGLMGAALAEAFLKAGHRVTVWNRTAGKADALINKGARAAGSAAEALSASEATIICVSDHAATMDILGAIADGEMADNRQLVQLSTMTADDSRETAGWAASRGFGYLEGTIMGLPSDVTGGSATIVYSGPREAFDASVAMLRAVAEPNFLSQEIGAAVSFDKVVYAFGYGVYHAFIQGAALAHANGFSQETYSGTVLAWLSKAISSGKFKRIGESIAARNHDVVEARLDVHAAAFADSLAMCRKIGVEDALPAAIMHNFERACAAGYGGHEISAVFEALIGDINP